MDCCHRRRRRLIVVNHASEGEAERSLENAQPIERALERVGCGRDRLYSGNRFFCGACGGGRKVLKALKNNKIVNEVNILWRLVAVGNG